MVKDLTVGKPERVLIRFCLPLLGSIIFQQLYNIADSVIAGKYAGEDALAAVGNSYEITLIYLAFAFGCNMGCSVVVSQFYGAGSLSKLKTTVYTTFISTFVLCITLMGIGFLCGGGLLRLINTPDEIFYASKLYLDIYTGGILFLFFYNVATGIFSALGDSATSFVFLVFSSVANIIADYIFVRYMYWGVAGVAWATFICQGVSCVLLLLVLKKRLSQLKTDADTKTVLFSKDILEKIVAIAVPSTLQQGFISLGNIVIQGIINSFGSAVVAGYSAAIKLNNMAITTFTALGNGMSNFTAQNVGAGKNDRIRDGLRAAIKLVLAICIPFVLLYVLAGSTFIGMFMKEKTEAAMSVGIKFLTIVAPFYFVVAIKLACDGVLRGVGAMKQFMTATFTDLILRVALAYIFSRQWQSTGIWCAWPVGWISGTILSVAFYKGLLRRRFNNG